MVLNTFIANNVKVYNVSSNGSSSLPQWVINKNKRALKKDAGWSQRIELIQDLEFPQACTRIRMTPDNNYIVASGVYKPQIRVFDLHDLSMKFDRHTTTNTVQFQILSDDWKKIVMLQSDRYIELHSQFGLHFRTRIPKFGRDIAYHSPSCDLLAVGASQDVYRLNLEQGTFLKPWSTSLNEINTVKINHLHDLVAVGGSDCLVELWDHRFNRQVATLPTVLNQIASYVPYEQTSVPEITALLFLPDGLSLAVGTSTGQVLLYDMRNPYPSLIKDHQYGYPIKALDYHQLSNILISADTKAVKMWSPIDGSILTYVEPQSEINDILIEQSTGLLMIAPEDQYIQSYFIPTIGPAPKWCSFLENITEELEQKPSTNLYENYKFTTKSELVALNLDNLIGTPMVKAYMHGFFIDNRLYEKTKAAAPQFIASSISNASTLNGFRGKMIDEKISLQTQSRIPVNDLPESHVHVNKELAAKLAKNKNTAIQSDKRFTDLFKDRDFEVDNESEAYKLLNSSNIKKQISRGGQESEEEGNSDSEKNESDEISSESSDSDDERGKTRPSVRMSRKSTPANGGVKSLEREKSFAELLKTNKNSYQNKRDSSYTSRSPFTMTFSVGKKERATKNTPQPNNRIDDPRKERQNKHRRRMPFYSKPKRF